MDAVALTCELIRRASVTPDDAGCQDVLIAHLARLGFSITRLPFGSVSNFWARRGSAAPLLAFAGHTDVVPSGPLEQWQTPPFEPVVRGDCVYGRGAADMKSALAAMVAAIEDFVSATPEPAGSIGVLVTSDEEGDAIDGTVKVVDYLTRHGTRIDYCVVGEPSSRDALGDTVRVGRRGSLNARVTVRGIQGHVAYPDRAVNPLHLAMPALLELTTRRWDDGNHYFPATSFQISNLHAGTGASNVVPGTLEMLCNFRFNTEQSPQHLAAEVEAIFARHDVTAEFQWMVSGMPFLTEHGPLVDAVCRSIGRTTGRIPELSTGGGTSDGRFIAPTGCEVVEVGVVNRTIHQADEHVRVDDIGKLADIYRHILAELLAASDSGDA
jgi:succinyl-diaminopimelate desuccinylase